MKYINYKKIKSAFVKQTWFDDIFIASFFYGLFLLDTERKLILNREWEK